MFCKKCSCEVGSLSSHSASVHQARTVLTVYGIKHRFDRLPDGHFHCNCGGYKNVNPAYLLQHLRSCYSMKRPSSSGGNEDIADLRQLAEAVQDLSQLQSLRSSNSDLPLSGSHCSVAVLEPLTSLANIAASSPYLEFELVSPTALVDRSNFYNISSSFYHLDQNCTCKTFLLNLAQSNGLKNTKEWWHCPSCLKKFKLKQSGQVKYGF